MKKVLIFILVVFIPFVAAKADEDSSKIIGSDFSNYVPVTSEEDAYSDENFMYFDTKFLISLGTGFQSWTSGAGKIFSPAYPTLELKLSHFTDVRFAIQYGFSYVNYAGNIAIADTVNGRSGLINLSQMRFSVDGKYFLRNSMQSQNDDNTMKVQSPNAFLLAGIEYSNYNLVFQQSNESFKFSGAMPCVGIGMDFALKPHHSSLEVEARYYPAGLVFPDLDFGGLIGGSRIGNVMAINTAVKFLFD